MAGGPVVAVKTRVLTFSLLVAGLAACVAGMPRVSNLGSNSGPWPNAVVYVVEGADAPSGLFGETRGAHLEPEQRTEIEARLKFVAPSIEFVFTERVPSDADRTVYLVESLGATLWGQAYPIAGVAAVGTSDHVWSLCFELAVADTIAHETGHLLGFAHSSDPNDVMSTLEYAHEYCVRERTAQ